MKKIIHLLFAIITLSVYAQSSLPPTWKRNTSGDIIPIDVTKKVGIGVDVPEANLHIKAGANSPNGAAIKLDAGTLTTGGNIAPGNLEWDGAKMYVTQTGSVRQELLMNNASQTISSGTWNGTAIGETFGGTGQTTYSTGDLLHATGTNTLGKLASVAAGSYLRSGGVTTAPVWSTTTLPNSATTGDLIFASATNSYSNLAGVATGNSLISGGVGTAPSWGKIGLTTHISGILPGANGGTGIDNTGKTITLGGNLTTTGAFNTTIVQGANTSITLPLVSSTLIANNLGLDGNTTIVGGTGAGGTLTLQSTSNATKGKILFGAGSTAYDGVNDRIGIGTANPLYKLHSTTNVNDSRAISASNTGAGTVSYGMFGEATGSALINVGVFGQATGGGIINYGVYGFTTSNNSFAVYGADQTTTAGGASTGVRAEKTGSKGTGDGYGLYSIASGTGTNNIALYGSASGATNNYGLIVDQGRAGFGTTAPAYKVDIATSVANDRGINIVNTASTGSGFGILSTITGAATTNTGLQGVADNAATNYGVLGRTSTNNSFGVQGDNSSTGTGTQTGVRGLKTGNQPSGEGRAVSGIATGTGGTNYGGFFQATGANTNYGIWGEIATASTTNGVGIIGRNIATDATGVQYGIRAQKLGNMVTGTGYAIHATATGTSGTNIALYGAASGADSNFGLIIAAGLGGFGTTTPTSNVDIDGTSGSQLRVRNSHTPTSSADASGQTGQISWDANYIYIKTAAGAWKRAALSTF